MRTRLALLVLVPLIATAPGAVAQGFEQDEGHCTNAARRSILSCWNFQAGAAIPERLGDYPEFLPFLRGWDFRINLPHVSFQAAGTGTGSETVLAGVDEDGTSPTADDGTLVRYGHRNNSLWMLRVANADRRLHAKQLPSRRDPGGSSPENVSSLTAGWSVLGTERLRLEKPAATVIGQGLGSTTLYVAARRDGDDVLLFTRRAIASTSSVLPGSWESLGITAAGRPTLAPAFGGRVALAWREPDTNAIKVRLYTPSTSSWGPIVGIPAATVGDPQLVWDGTALDLFFIAAGNRRLRHLYASDSSLGFRDLVDVSNFPVRAGAFHALAWNGRLHVAFKPEPAALGIHYTASRTPFGSLSQWVAAAPVGFSTTVAPVLAALADNLLVVGVSGGKVRFARRDPNRPGPEVTGAPGGRWLTPGQPVDAGSSGSYTGELDALTWNGDVYLTAGVSIGGQPGHGVRLVNLARAAFKHLITKRWGITLSWGALGGGSALDDGKVVFAKGADIPMLGDFDGDGQSDLIKFAQRKVSRDGPAPVYVARAPAKWEMERWHRFFSLKGEIPLVGDFNGDGKDDIVTFVQKQQKDAAGRSLGPAPVWVATSFGVTFRPSRIWHRFFSLKGEKPMVGDFNGDGKDDIVTFVQKRNPKIGQAPVWVALSDGTKFRPSRVWHTFFAPKGEVPLVGDFNFDGSDDIVTFLHDRVSGPRGRSVFVALSQGSSFSRSFLWMTDFAAKSDVPAIGTLGGRLSKITGRPQDADRPTTDLYAFRRNGEVRIASLMRRVPYPSAAPWERYKWFTDKGRGVALFPEWVWQRPKHCITSPHDFVLLGASGSATGRVTNLSVRAGSRDGHVLEEFGHSTFAICFRKTSDPMYAGIYGSAGIDAGNLWGGGPMRELDCPGGGDESGASAETIPPHPLAPPPNSRIPFYDCRRDIAEHYFLEVQRRFRLFGDEFRNLINTTTDAARRERLTRQYNWLRDVWYGGAEFKRGPAIAVGLTQDGLLCVPGECVAPGPKIITFDDLTTGGPGGAGALVAVSTQYSGQGVTFNNLSAIDYAKGGAAIPGFARSGTIAVEPCIGVELCTTPVRATFAKPQKLVRAWVGFSFPLNQPLQVQLRAYAGPTLVGTASATLPARSSPTAIRFPLEVQRATASITQIEISTSTGFNNALAVDDVTFEG